MSKLDTRGEGNKAAKLSTLQVMHIRYFHGQGRTQRALAKTFSVSRTQIWRIIHFKNWAWL